MGKIKEIIGNTKTGQIYVVVDNESMKRILRKDNLGYFILINKKIGLVDRFIDQKDISKIEQFLENW